MAIPLQLPPMAQLAQMAQIPMGVELPDPGSMPWPQFMDQMNARMANEAPLGTGQPGQNDPQRSQTAAQQPQGGAQRPQNGARGGRGGPSGRRPGMPGAAWLASARMLARGPPDHLDPACLRLLPCVSLLMMLEQLPAS